FFAIQPEQIERHEVRPPAPEQQRIEPRLSVRAEAHDFAIENCVVAAYRVCEFTAQGRPMLKRVAVTGDELRVMAVDVGQTTKAVVLQLVNEIRVVERLRDAYQPHRRKARKHSNTAY